MTGKQHASAVKLLIAVLIMMCAACDPVISSEQKAEVALLKQDLERIRIDIEQARNDEIKYEGGLIKNLIAIRIELLRTNEVLVEQRINTIEGRAGQRQIVNTVAPDAVKAADIEREIEQQRTAVAQLQDEAGRYSGGLLHAMALTNVATANNTIAMLEQARIIAKYGIAIPALGESANNAALVSSEKKLESTVKTSGAAVPERTETPTPRDCLHIDNLDSRLVGENSVFAELSWKVDVRNTCNRPFNVQVRFVVYDEEDFELDSDTGELYAEESNVSTARGKMLVNPVEKARRIAKQGATASGR